MAVFDFLKSKRDKQSEKVATFQQQIISLQEEVDSIEKKKEDLQSQVQELGNQVVVQKNELYDLRRDKEKTNKQLKKLKETFERLDKVLKSSTRQVKGIPSSDDTPIISLFDNYLISIDEEDFQELSKYYSLKEENKSFCERKEQREGILLEIEDKIKEANNKLIQLREEMVKQQEINHTYEINIIQKEISKYYNELSEIKKNIDGYLKTHKDKIRFEMMHEIYQRFTICEDNTLKKMRENLDTVILTDLYELTSEDKKIVRNGCLVKEERVLYNLQRLCEEFIQLNIVKLTREMKSSDWDSVKLEIGSMIQIVESLLLSYGYTISKYYFESLYNILEAKYIRIQKQELEREKEREEREAQRDYERAIKKALKEEEKAQEALEKKKKELAEEQAQEKILKLQEQIHDLEKALIEAHELRERAMSMAQQTKIGYVYVISNIGSFGKDVYKIGMTRRLDPMERVLELSNASVPFPFDVHTFIYSEDAPALEADLHRRFDAKKVNSMNYRKEYFHVTLDEIKAALEEKGVDANFVDEPDAFQYRESLLRNEDFSYTL
jgi:predicted  nucleic acid-binding Zn-ribbon protein